MDRHCRFCGSPELETFADLGMSPLSNSYVGSESLGRMEPFYPLHAFVCSECYLVQLEEFESPEAIFSDYAYFSSYSDSWLDHCRRYVEQMTETYEIDSGSRVVEIASNDGYLLQYFRERGVPVLGVEPAANVAEHAVAKGIPTEVTFFGAETAASIAERHGRADLLLGNNVLAHVPDLNDFVAGMKVLLAADGVITMEFPHLLRLMLENQFDTIYHEHFSYLSILAVERIFAAHDLRVFDVEQLPTHGGSLRIHACHAEAGRPIGEGLWEVRRLEQEHGLHEIDSYREFESRVRRTKQALLAFLLEAKTNGRTVVGYGAPAKGNTLLNYCGIRNDFLDYTVDRSPHKQGRYLPGTHIPILAPEAIRESRPDYVLILPWNLRDEIMAQMSDIRDWGGQFVLPIPELRVCA